MITSEVMRFHHRIKPLKSIIKKNKAVHSLLTGYENHVPYTAVTVKTVLSGTERYRLNGKRYDVAAGDFLLVEADQELDITIDDKKTVAEGVCLYVDEKYVHQAMAQAAFGAAIGLDMEWQSKNRATMLSTKYQIAGNAFGNYLHQVATNIKSNSSVSLSEDFFLDFATHLIDYQKDVALSINKLSSMRLATRQELYCRAIIARDYIEQNPVGSVITIQELAQVSSLSEVQLHRTYKQVFGCTPHQYILRRKMKNALEMLRLDQLLISDIALLLGFSDLPTFSKAFKRVYGMSPVAFRQSRALSNVFRNQKHKMN